MRRKTGLSRGAILAREPEHRGMDLYEIRVAGHLSERRAHALGCEELRLLPGGDSLLTFTAADQAALYGLLTRLRDAGLELVAAERVLGPAQGRTEAQRSPNDQKEDPHVADRRRAEHH